MEVWRVNLTQRSLEREPIPEAWSKLGGRGLSARILLDEVPPACEPLGPYNKLVVAPGLLVGHMLSACDRISFGGKSPMTGGVKEANSGGTTGLHVAALGMKALIVEGALPAEVGWGILHLSAAGARVEPAAELTGLGVYDNSAEADPRSGAAPEPHIFKDEVSYRDGSGMLTIARMAGGAR